MQPFHAVQVLEEAAAIDAKAAAGQSILPLCGLPLVVKDTIDCLPYATSAATPALLGEIQASQTLACTVTLLLGAHPSQASVDLLTFTKDGEHTPCKQQIGEAADVSSAEALPCCRSLSPF